MPRDPASAGVGLRPAVRTASERPALDGETVCAFDRHPLDDIVSVEHHSMCQVNRFTPSCGGDSPEVCSRKPTTWETAMKRMALLTMAGVLCLGAASLAEAGLLSGLFSHGDSCCSPKPSCCQPKPTCCAPAPTCCKPQPTCCAPQPTCCAPVPTCAAPAPSCATPATTPPPQPYEETPPPPKSDEKPPAPKKG